MERLTDERAVIKPGTYLVSDDLLDDVPEIRNVSKKELYYRLGLIENALGKNYDLGHLRELIEADREGRCVVLNTGYTETAGGKALKQAMYLCSVTNNEVTRYTADAIAEKLVREERFFEAVKERK